MTLNGRSYLSLAWALVMTLPALAATQSPPTTMPRIGLLAWSDCDEPSFLRGLAELGYKRGETVTIECRSADRRYAALPTAAAELIELQVDVIVTMSQPAGMAAHNATDTIPIVSLVSGDPVAAGLARSLAKPGGDVTGVSYYVTELIAKRLELLKEIIPEVITIDVLANPDVAYLPFEEDTKRAAGQLGLSLRIHQISDPAELENAFAVMKAEDAEALFVLPDVMFAHEAPRIAGSALDRHLPTMAWGDWFTRAGCLVAYSARYDEMAHRLASYVDRILTGAKPGDLPIEQPTTFELSINLKTAQQLGITIPPAILLRADEVIE